MWMAPYMFNGVNQYFAVFSLIYLSDIPFSFSNQVLTKLTGRAYQINVQIKYETGI